MTTGQQTRFDDLLLETKDGEWGEGEEAHGHTLCEIVRGTDFADLHDANLDLPRRWIPDHLVERKALRAGDILIETAGGTAKQSTGRTAFLTESFFSRHRGMPVLCSSFARHLRVDANKVRPDYLYYVLQALYRAGYMAVFNLQHTGVARFQFTAFRKKTSLIMASREAQRKIAAVLSAYDNLIANTQRRIALLEGMAEEIYREWFVRMRFPGANTAAMNQGLPIDWTRKKLDALLVESKRPLKMADLSTVQRYVGLEHIPRKRVVLDAWALPESVDSDKLLFEAGDILFSKIRPYLHKISIAPFSGACSTDTIVLKPRQQTSMLFAYFTVFSDTFVDLATASSNGTKMPRANWSFLKSVEVTVPPDNLLSAFNLAAKPMIDQVTALLSMNERLVNARDALLPRLISGKLKVDHLDIRLPPSMRAEAEAAA